MALPTSYMTGGFSKIPQYFDTLLTARAPEKFTAKFLADLGYTSSNDRLFVNVLKALGFLDEGGTPSERYFRFLDQSCSKKVVAEGIREAYVDLFNLNVSAQNMAQSEVEGKFKTLTNGSKANATITQMAKTFVSLCAYADWTENVAPVVTIEAPLKEENKPFNNEETKNIAKDKGRVGLDLNYNIHIHLPATRDQAVYDALFASLAKHIPLE